MTIKSEEKTSGAEYGDLDCQGLNFVPPDCTSWFLDKEEYGPVNVFNALEGLFSMLTFQDPPLQEALD